ncbi:midnolin homolog [Ixodes scapularis]|uniref:midnolin homolog n=1 Tax=Ixodes scapularis TaxID=6945 RepID=UPI001A9EF2C1|nr:midnolin homolog [Ixodes scapularis]
MKSAFIAALLFIVVEGAQDHSGARTFVTSQNVGISGDSHSAHHLDHATHVVSGHEHHHQDAQTQQEVIAVSSDAIRVKNVPVFVGQIVNVRVVSTVPQASGGTVIGASGVVSSLVETQQQVVSNITAGFGNAVQNFVNPVVAPLHNASVWLNRTSQTISVGSHPHDHAHHHHLGAHTATHVHESHHEHGHDHHGSAQPSSGGPISVLVIQDQQRPAATIGAGVPTSLGTSSDASTGQILTLGNSASASGGQFFSFGAPAPVAALGNFLASAVAPIFGTAGPASTFQAALPSSTVPATAAFANGTETASSLLFNVTGTTADSTVVPAAPVSAVSAGAPLQSIVTSKPKNRTA